MIVSHKHKFAYMAPNKTGCTSMVNWLEKAFDAEIWSPHQTKWPAHDAHLHKDMNGYFVFATVRNPYHHEISYWNHWWNTQKTKTPFSEFVEKGLCADVHRMINLHKGYKPPPDCVKFKLDMFIRLEHTNEDIKKLPFYRDKAFEKYKHRNKGNYFKPYANERMLRIIKSRRRKDFEMFGYDDAFPSDLLWSRILHQ